MSGVTKDYPTTTLAATAGPSNQNAAKDGESEPLDPFLLLPNMSEDANEEQNQDPISRRTTTSIPHRYDATNTIDYLTAQAWIASAPSGATANIGLLTSSFSAGNESHENNTSWRGHPSYNNNNDAGQQHQPEEFQDEFVDVLGNQHSRNQPPGLNNNNKRMLRNSFGGLRKGLFSYQSQGVRQQEKEQQQADHPRRDSASMPSTPPSVLEDLMDTSFHNNNNNNNRAGGSNDDGGEKMAAKHSYGPAPRLRNISGGGGNDNNKNRDVGDGGGDDDDDEPNRHGNTGAGSLEAVAVSGDVLADQESPFLWMRNGTDDPHYWVPNEIVVDDQQRGSVEDENLTGDGERTTTPRNRDESGGAARALFRPPTLLAALSRPVAIRGEDRQHTPQSWHTPLTTGSNQNMNNTMMRPGAYHQRNTSGGSTRRSRSSGVPISPGSFRSAKMSATRSEKYYHSYETDPTSPPRPVPPFVVVHSAGSAVVRVTPKTTTLAAQKTKQTRARGAAAGYQGTHHQPPAVVSEENENDKPNGCGGCGTANESSSAVVAWCLKWGRPVTIALASAVVVLALVTVVTSLVASRTQNNGPLRPQTTNILQEGTETLVMNPPRIPSPSMPPISVPSISTPVDDTNNANGKEDLVPEADDGVAPGGNGGAAAATGSSSNTEAPLVWEGVVKRPYEDTENPAAPRPTSPPRTKSPTTRPSERTQAPTVLPENFTDSVPVDLPFLPTSAPSSEAQLTVPWNNYVIGLLSVESPGTFSVLHDSASSQYMALQWISVDSHRKGGSLAFTMDTSLQRYALATIYFAMGGGLWSNDDSWLSSVVHECDWHGVACDDETNAMVVSLNLQDNGLSGSLPDELKLLKDLRALGLGGNSIEGTLPPEYSYLENLEELYLSGNLVEGSIPWEYGKFSSLKILNLSSNKLGGRLPSELGSLNSLEELVLCSNDLTGPIPPSLGNLNGLKSLSVGKNRFSESLPSPICELVTGDYGFLSRVVADSTVECNCCTGYCSDGDDSNDCC